MSGCWHILAHVYIWAELIRVYMRQTHVYMSLMPSELPVYPGMCLRVL